MRVSSTLNKVTAPILYRTVTLRAGTTSPYDTTCGRRNPARISPNTADNIELIKKVIIKSHHTHDTVDGLFQGQTDVESVRLCPSVLMPGRKCSQCPANGPASDTHQPYQIMDMFRPKKLILFGGRCGLGFETIQTVVFVISSIQGRILTRSNRLQQGSSASSRYSGRRDQLAFAAILQ